MRTARQRPVLGTQAIKLIPQPSNNPKDPFNWSPRRKHLILFTLCLSAFSGVGSVSVHQLAYVKQTVTYHRSPVELSYSISAGIAGVMVGPLIFVPLTSIIGRSSMVFWSLLCTLGCNVWSPLMTGSNDYIPFLISRLLAGIFGSIPAVLTSGYIMDMYFLHQRGKAFTALEVAYLSGFLVTPALGGFIADSRPWPFVFWWLVAVNGFALVLVILTLEDTSFEDDKTDSVQKSSQKSYPAHRAALLLYSFATTPHVPPRNLAQRFITPFLIGLSPVVIIAGLFVIPIFGFLIGTGITSSIFLQTPESEGGYGFTPLQNAAFNTSWWLALIVCQACGYFLNDRIPLRIASRTGAWHPEHRLYNIFLVVAASPIGFGIFGAGLQYHLHYMVLTLGVFLVIFGGTYSIPVVVNYVTECFPGSPLEVSIVMSVYRQALGLSIPFFIMQWRERVGSGWLFGMMSFICVAVSLLMMLVVFRGEKLRRYNLISEVTEDGESVADSGTSDDSTLKEVA